MTNSHLARRCCTLLVSLAVAGVAGAQTLTKDIRPGLGPNPTTSFSSDRMFGDGARVFFGAGAHDLTVEPIVFVTDGTAAGTRVLSELQTPQAFVRLGNGVVLFVANDPQSSGFELRRTDGTTAGTVLVKDLWPGSGNGISSLASVLYSLLGNRLLLAATDGTAGSEPWITDGTAQGTALLADINPGSAPSSPGQGAVVQGRAVFPASDGVNGTELWMTDGTPAGTALLANIHPSGSSSPANLVALGNLVLFAANDGASGTELWRTDGTTAGTVQVGDLVPGSGGSSPVQLTVVGASCFFVATTPASGAELWVTDGITATLVRDIRPGATGSGIGRLFDVGGTLMFTADDGTSGLELWRSDGTTNGTQMVADLTPGGSTAFSPIPSAALAIGNQLAFAATAQGLGEELWASDGTAAGTRLVTDIWPGANGSRPYGFTSMNGTLVFCAMDGVIGRELWRSDLTTTVLAADVSGPKPASAEVEDWIALGDRVLFNANDGGTGDELWVSDGTPAGTQLLLDINTAPGAGSAPRGFTAWGNRVLFRATDALGSELWITDGTAAGTRRVADIASGSGDSTPRHFTEFNGVVYFSAYQPGTGGVQLWRTDGTAAGTSKVSTVQIHDIAPNPIRVVNGRLVIMGLLDIYQSNGTQVALLDPANPITSNSTAPTLVHEGALYFIGTRGTQKDLWRTDGTAAGTLHLKTLNSTCTTITGGLYIFTAWGGRVFLTATDTCRPNTNTGFELYVSDGTPAGTVLVSDVWPGYGSSMPTNFAPTHDALLFSANDGTTGTELWRTDGTAAGTVRVADLLPGSPGALAGATNFVAPLGNGTRVLFGARTPATGQEPWISDGTAAGTQQLFDLNPGPGSGIPVMSFRFPRTPRPIAAGDHLFFIADDGTSGGEVHSVSLLALGAAQFTKVGQGCSGSAGVPRIAGTGVPVPARTFQVELASAAPSALTALVLGAARQDLALGNGCTLYPLLPGIDLRATTSSGGNASVVLPLPNNASFIGVDLWFQWAVVDPVGAFLNAVSFSDGLRVRIGRS